MSPSRRHEVTAESIADLLQEYFKATRTKYYPLGSTTFRKKEQKSGKEPDKSYCIDTEKEFPDLDLSMLAGYVLRENSLEAALDFRQRIEDMS